MFRFSDQHQKMSYPSILATAPAAAEQLPKSVVFGTAGLGGMLGWAIVHPFNTVAVRANLASASGKTFSLTEMAAKQGWMSVYDGLSAGVARQIFYATSRFGLFETFREKLHQIRGKTDFASRYVQIVSSFRKLPENHCRFIFGSLFLRHRDHDHRSKVWT